MYKNLFLRKFILFSIILFCGGFLIIASPHIVKAATYCTTDAGNCYVDGVSGLDTNNGKTTTTAWKTIQHAASTVGAGDTVNVKGGITYNETVTPATTGTSGNVITYQSWSGTGIPTIDGVTDGFVVSSKNYLTFSGFYIIGSVKGFNLSTTNTYITIKNNIINGCTGNGIDSGASSNNISIYNNTIYGNADTGVKIVGGTGTELKNNIITDNDVYGIYKVSGTLTLSYNNVWNNATNYFNSSGTNSISLDPLYIDPAGDNFQLYKSSPSIDTGVTLAVVTTDILGTARPQGAEYDMGAYEKELTHTTYYVSGDTGSDSNGGSINSPWKTIQKAADNTMAGDTVNVKGGISYTDNDADNSVVNMNRSGTPGFLITFQPWQGTGTPFIDLQNTVFIGFGVAVNRRYVVIDGFSVINPRSNITSWGIRLNQDNQGTIVKNNFIAGGSNKFYVGIRVQPTTLGDMQVLNNTIVGADRGIEIGVGFTGPTSIKNNIITDCTIGVNIIISSVLPDLDYTIVYNNITDYSGLSAGVHDININPLFVDPANANFRLQKSSPAINKGVTLSVVTTDILGVPRPQESVYDIGAYEYYDIPVNLTALSPDPSNDSTPTLLGASSTISGGTITQIEYSLNGGAWTTAGVSGTSSFSITPSTLTDGSYSILVRAMDSFGNITDSVLYASDNFTIDTTSPDSPDLEQLGALVFNPSATHWYLTGAKPVFSGTAEPSSIVTLSIGSFSVNITVDSDGNWFYQPQDQLNTDNYTVTLFDTDQAGNKSGSWSFDLTIDPTMNLFPESLREKFASTGGGGVNEDTGETYTEPAKEDTSHGTEGNEQPQGGETNTQETTTGEEHERSLITTIIIGTCLASLLVIVILVIITVLKGKRSTRSK